MIIDNDNPEKIKAIKEELKRKISGMNPSDVLNSLLAKKIPASAPEYDRQIFTEGLKILKTRKLTDEELNLFILALIGFNITEI